MMKIIRKNHSLYSLEGKIEPKGLFDIQGPETDVMAKAWYLLISLSNSLVWCLICMFSRSSKYKKTSVFIIIRINGPTSVLQRSMERNISTVALTVRCSLLW